MQCDVYDNAIRVPPQSAVFDLIFLAVVLDLERIGRGVDLDFDLAKFSVKLGVRVLPLGCIFDREGRCTNRRMECLRRSACCK